MKKRLFVVVLVLALVSNAVFAQGDAYDKERFDTEFDASIAAFNVHVNLFVGRGGREVNGYDAYQYLLTIMRLLEIGKANGFLTEVEYSHLSTNVMTVALQMSAKAWNMGYESLESMIAWVERNRLR